MQKRLEQCIRVEAWRAMAWETAGWQCPRLQTLMPVVKSRYSRPSRSQSLEPSPRTMMGAEKL